MGDTPDIFLATDSHDAAKSFTRAMTTALPHARVLGLHYDRSALSGEGVERPGPGVLSPTYIEHRNEKGQIDRREALVNYVGEVLLLSRASAFVGTPSSAASMLIFLSLVGRHGTIPPFEFLDAPVACVITGETRDDCRKDRASWAGKLFLSPSEKPGEPRNGSTSSLGTLETAFSRANLYKKGKFGSLGAAGENSFIANAALQEERHQKEVMMEKSAEGSRKRREAQGKPVIVRRKRAGLERLGQ